MQRPLLAALLAAAVLCRAPLLRATHAPAPAGPREHDFSQWAASVHRELDGHLAGGYAFAVAHAGRVTMTGAYGWARAPWERIRPGERWSLETPMALASVSKTITAIALLHLWDEQQHRFSLDEPFWPLLARIAPDAGAEVRQITIRQLMMHRSGIANVKDVQTTAELRALLRQPLEFAPGSKEAYHNNNYYVLRLVLEQLAHGQYTQYVEEHVLRPMGIADMNTKAPAAGLAVGYKKPGERGPGYAFDWDVTSSAGAAGWYGSVNDLVRFVQRVRDPGTLSDAAWKETWRDRLGWDRQQPGLEKGGDFYWQSPGGSGEVHSAIAMYPDDVQAVMLINCVPPKGPTDVLNDAWQASRR